MEKEENRKWKCVNISAVNTLTATQTITINQHG